MIQLILSVRPAISNFWKHVLVQYDEGATPMWANELESQAYIAQETIDAGS